MQSNEILMITSFPPRKCGIATYSQDLIKAIEDKYDHSFSIKVCALKKKNADLEYPSKVKYTLKTWLKKDYKRLAIQINADQNVKIIYLQHEFGLYDGELGNYLLDFLDDIEKPVITTFHTVLGDPSVERQVIIQRIADLSRQIIVMTKLSSTILETTYRISKSKIKIIPHGTHLIKPFSLIENTPFKDKIMLSTFGLISEGKGIETALEAMPRIIAKFPNVLYLVIGKTHPEVIKNEGETYRSFLEEKVKALKIESHVLFINKYLSLEILLEYLHRTDLYFFTSKDPQQAVSGTLVYALAAACPVISTPIPHSLEMLDGAGINFEFGNAIQLSEAAILILSNPEMMQNMKLNALHKISPTAWQNAAIAHIAIAKELLKPEHLEINYKIPEIDLSHIKRMTTSFGIIQFAKIADPDLSSGYTIDDNSRALIAVAKHFELTGKFSDLSLINTYLNYIIFCQQEDGSFLNYVTIDKYFFKKNKNENLEDANGRTIWALGEFLSLNQLIDFNLQAKVEDAFKKVIPTISLLQSPRAIAFSIKGLCQYHQFKKDESILRLITQLADDLVSKYRGVSEDDWHWFEEYLTYANAVLPQAMLMAGQFTMNELFKEVAYKTFAFLLKIIFKNRKINVISNQTWHHKGAYNNSIYGEQPIEIAYTILALESFYFETKNEDFFKKMKTAFNWFLGENHLNQIIYNPSTGGCYDGLEEHQVNLNQGAESALSYLLSRLTVENHLTS